LNQTGATAATLAGNGTVNGITAGAGGGTVVPGLIDGTLGTLTSTGAVALNANSTYKVQLSAHTGSRLALAGSLKTSLNLGGARLQVLGSVGSSPEDVFTLIAGSPAGAPTASQFGTISVGGSAPQAAADSSVVTVAATGEQFQL